MHSPSRYELESVNLDGAGQLMQLRWADGHTSIMPWMLLRAACPCASCTQPGAEPEAAVPELRDVFEVGHYALNLHWQDGHQTGIYTFETLRHLCPCCGPRAGAARPGAAAPA